MNKGKVGWREVQCRSCGGRVKIPWLWVLGVEMIFYCKNCRDRLRIHYRLGAVLTGVGWALALVTIQGLTWFASKFTISLAALVFLPLGFLYSFLLRRFFLRHAKRRKPPHDEKPLSDKESCDS
jgi:hypothetical protein